MFIILAVVNDYRRNGRIFLDSREVPSTIDPPSQLEA
jgi:hypothetical protein